MSNTMSFATGEHANKMILPGSNHSHTPVQDLTGMGAMILCCNMTIQPYLSGIPMAQE